jgi:hypothetical protein
VSSAGLSTIALPATSAGNSFQLGIATGKFHGVIRPTTPIGSRQAKHILSVSSDGTVSPFGRRPSPAM